MYRYIKIPLTVIIIAYVLFGVFGCAWLEPGNQTEMAQTPQQEQQNVSPAYGGKLVFSIPGLFSTNPLLVTNHEEGNFFSLVYEGLVKYDDELKVVPALAKSWSIQEDGQTVVFNLRDNIKWHDGQLFSADDVKFTLDILFDNRMQSVYKEDLDRITGYSVIDDTTLEVTFGMAYKDVLDLFTFPILSAKQYDGTNNVFAENATVPVGTGPYRIREYRARRALYLERFEDWWKASPYIDKIEVILVPDRDSMIATFETKQTDLVRTDATNSRKYEETGDTNYYKLMTQNYELVALNFNNIGIQQKEVRQAMAHAIDREGILTDILLGHGMIVDTPIPPNCWMYMAASNIYKYDSGRARKILQDVGWRILGQDDTFSKDINDLKVSLAFTLLVNENDKIRCQVADMIKKNLKEAGIQIDIQLLDVEQLNNRLQAKDFDMALIGWNLSPKYNLNFALHSNGIEEGDNFISYSNAKMDTLLDKLGQAMDEGTAKELYGDFQTLFAEELPYLSLYYRTSSLLIKDEVKGINPVREDQLFNGIEEWYISPGRGNPDNVDAN